MSEQARERPIKEYRAGAVHAAIWGKEVTRNGRKWTEHSVRVQRHYKDERSGDWRTTTYFRPEDLPKLVLAANKAYEHIMLKDTDAGEAPKAPN